MRTSVLLSPGLACVVAFIVAACGASSKNPTNTADDKDGGGTGGDPGDDGGDGAGGTGGKAAGGRGGGKQNGGRSSGGEANGGRSSGGTPAHVVGTCDDLGEVGKWEEITPAGALINPPYDGPLITLVDPVTTGTIYSMTVHSGVFKSTDCGSTWVKTNTGRNGDQLDLGKIWSAQIDPLHPNVIYAITGYGPAGLWKSTDSGVNWDQILPLDRGMPGFVARIGMDATNPLHIVVNFHDNCTGGHTPVCFGETKDGGDTWNVLDFPTALKNQWGEGTFVLPIDEKRWIYENWELYFTADGGVTWNKGSDGVAAQGGYVQLPDKSLYVASASGILSSPDGAQWTRIPDSGHGFDAIVGDGSRIFAAQGFQPPQGQDIVWAATYDAPTQWAAFSVTGLPDRLSGGANDLAYEADHKLLFMAAQSGGLWRVVTK